MILNLLLFLLSLSLSSLSSSLSDSTSLLDLDLEDLDGSVNDFLDLDGLFLFFVVFLFLLGSSSSSSSSSSTSSSLSSDFFFVLDTLDFLVCAYNFFNASPSLICLVKFFDGNRLLRNFLYSRLSSSSSSSSLE